MTINEIKAKLGVEKLALNWFVAEDGTKTDWLRNWDNTQRRAVLMHGDVYQIVKSTPEFANFGLKEEEKSSELGKFKSYTIVAYKPADVEI